MRDVGRHHLQVDPTLAEVAERQRPGRAPVLPREGVDQVGQPRRQGGRGAVRRHPRAHPEAVPSERAWEADGEAEAEGEHQPEHREDDARRDRAGRERARAGPRGEHHERETGEDTGERGEREAPERRANDPEPLAGAPTAEPGHEEA